MGSAFGFETHHIYPSNMHIVKQSSLINLIRNDLP